MDSFCSPLTKRPKFSGVISSLFAKSFCVKPLSLPDHPYNRMESPRIPIIIHLHITFIVLDRAPYAFHAQSMPGAVSLMGKKLAVGIKWIFRAGVLDRKYDIRCIFLPPDVKFDEGILNTGSGFYRIVQKITKEGCQVIGGHKIDTAVPDIGSKVNVLFFTEFFISAENGIEGIVLT